MKKAIVALSLSLILPGAWADEVDCAITPYYGICPNCESTVPEDDARIGATPAPSEAREIEKTGPPITVAGPGSK
jgi:hypothetical protein